MKRFSKKRKKNILFVAILLVLLFDIFIFNWFGFRLSDNISKMTRVIIEELTKYYMNSVIKKYLNVDSSNYIKINFVNNNLVSIDIDNHDCNNLLNSINEELENVVKNIEKGKINSYENLEFLHGNNGIMLMVSLGTAFNNSLLYDIGPKIPVKISFLENVDAYVDVKVENYGINNSLIKLYINISMEQLIEMPIDKEKTVSQYNFLIASKLVTGKVPEVYGYGLNSNSHIVNGGVN